MADRPQPGHDGDRASNPQSQPHPQPQEQTTTTNSSSSSNDSHERPPPFPATTPIGFFSVFPPAPPAPASPTSPSDNTPLPLPSNVDEPTPEEDAAVSDWLRRNMSYVTTVPWYRLAALPVLSPLWGYNPADHQTDCLESLMFYTVAAGRRLTDAERDSILEHITRTGVAASYDRPLAIGVAAWLMTRSWAKSRPIKHGGPLYNAASASTYSPYAQQYHHHAHVQPISTGTLGADGHITHFSGPHPPPPPPQQQPQQPYFASARGSGSQVLGAFVRRVARTGAVGLSCFAGYLALRIPYRHLLGMREVEAVSHDFRLEAVCHDMDNTMKNRSNRRDVD